MSAGSALARSWRERGQTVSIAGEDVWFLDTGSPVAQTGPPVVLIHGFPTCSYDWRRVVDDLSGTRRVVVMDLPGYGSSAKPDRAYPIEGQADAVIGVLNHCGVTEIDLITHDMGDTVGGAVLALDLEGQEIGFSIRRRVLTNGSVYIDMAQLTIGQRIGERMGDRRLPALAGPVLRAMYRVGIGRTFGDAGMDPDEGEALWALMSTDSGHLNLPRLIRYIEERRNHEERWTGAIETHPSPVSVVWGELDPVAVVAMAHRFVDRRPGTELTVLDRVGHFPMLEAPARFISAIRADLDT